MNNIHPPTEAGYRVSDQVAVLVSEQRRGLITETEMATKLWHFAAQLVAETSHQEGQR